MFCCIICPLFIFSSFCPCANFSIPTLGLVRAQKAPQEITVALALAVVLTSKVWEERWATLEKQRHMTANTWRHYGRGERETWSKDVLEVWRMRCGMNSRVAETETVKHQSKASKMEWGKANGHRVSKSDQGQIEFMELHFLCYFTLSITAHKKGTENWLSKMSFLLFDDSNGKKQIQKTCENTWEHDNWDHGKTMITVLLFISFWKCVGYCLLYRLSVYKQHDVSITSQTASVWIKLSVHAGIVLWHLECFFCCATCIKVELFPWYPVWVFYVSKGKVNFLNSKIYKL